MQPNLGTTQYYKTLVNGSDVYSALPYGGNTPYGYNPVSQDEYKTAVQSRISQLQSNPSLGGGSGTWGNIDPLQQSLSDINNQSGIHAPNYVDPGFSKFNPQGQPNQNNYTSAEQARVASIPFNLGGTGPTTALPINKTNTLTGAFQGVPTGNTSTPDLPTQTYSNTTQSYYNSLTSQISSLQTQLDTQRQQQLDKLNADKNTAQTNLDNANTNEDTAIKASQTAKLAQITLEEQRFDDNYKIVQGLTSQLTDLMTKGNALIEQERGVTGLASLRDPRIQQTINSVTASTGVIKAAIDAYNGQMTAARDQLTTATAAITSAYSDQINYYDSIRKFYQDGVVTATADQKKFTNDTIALLENRLKTVQDNSQKLQDEFLDPAKALAFAQAGITINTPQDQWGPLLAKQAYSVELSKEAEARANDGYTQLFTGTAPKGSQVVTVTDSKGINHTWYKTVAPTAASQTWSAPYTLNGKQVQKNNTTGEVRNIGGSDGINNTYSTNDTQSLIGAGIPASKIPSIKSYVETYGLDAALKNSDMTDDQKKALKALYGQ